MVVRQFGTLMCFRLRVVAILDVMRRLSHDSSHSIYRWPSCLVSQFLTCFIVGRFPVLSG